MIDLPEPRPSENINIVFTLEDVQTYTRGDPDHIRAIFAAYVRRRDVHVDWVHGPQGPFPTFSWPQIDELCRMYFEDVERWEACEVTGVRREHVDGPFLPPQLSPQELGRLVAIHKTVQEVSRYLQYELAGIETGRKL